MPPALGDSEKRTTAWRALTLSERIDVWDASEKVFSDEFSSDGRDGATAFLNEWREQLGGEERLERRLSLDGLSEETCVACVRRDEWPEDEPLPDWVAIADELVAAAEEWHGVASRECEFAAAEYPFEHALMPWIEFARERLSVPLDRFSESATDSLCEWLLRRLVEVTAEPLFVEFKAFAASQQGSPPEDGSRERDADSREHYDVFAEEVASGDGLRHLFAEYPVLARFASQTVRQWVDAVEELDRRLRDDWERLRETFADGESATRVRDLDVLTSDRHADGRAVFALRLDSGTKVVYKPRSISAEVFLDDVLTDLNRRTGFDFRTVTCLDRDGYGWMEWVAHDDCSTRDAVARYYWRAGGLLCLAYALGLTDCHFENVVAAGEYPVIVDAETVLQPKLPRSKLPGDRPRNGAIVDSVLRTGLLRMDASDDVEYRIGGFTATEVSATAPRHDSARWEATNTDAVEYNPGAEVEDRKRNRPTFGGETESVESYLDALERGFDEMYRYLAARGPELLDDHAEALDAVEIRVPVAPTRLYSSMIRAVTSPDCLSSGLDVTRKLDESVSTLLSAEIIDDDLWRIYGWERDAVIRTDVPRFTVRPSERRIRYGTETSGEFLESSGVELASHRLSSLDSSDLSTQLEHVRAAVELASSR